MTGSLSILNVGAGDITLSFNQHDDAELKRAIEILTAARDRGFAILVKQEDGSYARAVDIDPNRGVYIIGGKSLPAVKERLALPPIPEGADAGVEVYDAPADVVDAPRPKRRGRPPGRREQPIARSHAVGVARSAGG